jgi:hypothetical protein
LFAQMRLIAWPIGHGLFTQASLSVRDQVFNLVYDCGTQTDGNILATSINRFSRNKLDLLVISHFHGDHISGIPALLNRTGGAHRAWIPYVAPTERILLVVENLAGIASGDNGGRTPAHVLDIIGGPTRRLGELGVDSVHEVGGGQGESEESHSPDFDESDNNTRRREDPELQHEDGEHSYAHELKINSVSSWPGCFVERPDVNALTALVQGGTRASTPVFRLVTWNRPPRHANAEKVCEEILKALGDGSRRIFEPLYDGAKKELTSKEISSLVRGISGKPGVVGRIRDILRNRAHSDPNSTSLFLLGHALPLRKMPWGWRCSTYTPPCRANLEKAVPTILWTGDAPAAGLREVLRDASGELSRRLAYTSAWQIPHHGSVDSHCPEFYEALASPIGYMTCALNDKYHPSTRVSRDTKAEIVHEQSQPFLMHFEWDL